MEEQNYANVPWYWPIVAFAIVALFGSFWVWLLTFVVNHR